MTTEKPTPTKVRYSFTVRGRTPTGTKITFHGHVTDVPSYPMSAFSTALKLCVKAVGTLTPNEKNGVTLRQLKR